MFGIFFFFKQKTAYEMRISDWSSDVCSSDLQLYHHRGTPVPGYARPQTLRLLRERFGYAFEGRHGYHPTIEPHALPDGLRIGDISIACTDQIGRASCRERVCQYV